jgi:hypothetical protein
MNLLAIVCAPCHRRQQFELAIVVVVAAFSGCIDKTAQARCTNGSLKDWWLTSSSIWELFTHRIAGYRPGVLGSSRDPHTPR